MIIETDHLSIKAEYIYAVSFKIDSALVWMGTISHEIPASEGREVIRKWKEWKAQPRGVNFPGIATAPRTEYGK